MRHVPYAAAVAAHGGEELTSMAISAATTAEESWFGGGGAGGSGGQTGVARANGGGGSAVDAVSNGVAGRAACPDLAAAWLSSDVRTVSTSGEQRRSSASLVAGRNEPLEPVEEAEPSDDEVICGRSSSADKRSLFWSAFSATLVPSRRAEAGERRQNRRRNPFRQRRRRANLSNVVEAQHENGAGAGASEPVGSDSVGSGRSVSVVSNRNPRPVNGDVAAPAGFSCQSNADLSCQSNVDFSCQSNAASVSDGESAISASKSIAETKLTIQSNKAVPVSKSTILGPKLRSGDAVALNGGTDGENHIRQRGPPFPSLPEDEGDDSVCELEADYEEWTGLLERSASVPDAEPKAIRWTAKAAKAASMTSVTGDSAESADLGDAVKRSHSSGSDASGGGGSKLGKWSKSKLDLWVPSIKSLVTMTTNKLASSSSKASCRRRSGCSGSTNNLFASSSTSFSRFDVGAFEATPKVDSLRRNISLSCMSNGCRYEPMNTHSTDNLSGTGALTKKLRKCNTMVALTGGAGCAVSANPCGTVHVEPMRPVNRLRVSSQELQAASRVCSRCSSLLSMAWSSQYSLNSSYGFVPVSGVLCKVCLNEVPLKDSWTLQHCECSYCVDCVRSYVEFEINQGAYSISCPDAQCEKQGIIMLEEIESLVSLENREKHKRYRLNREVEMDKSRTWCPRAGCETVCTLCSTDRCTPQSVHCPTCSMDFCSNCRAAWHADSPCKSEEVVPGVTFDSELIKCCPMCSVPIEKDEGCAQMLCKRCKHVFCWYCLASLDDDFLLRHYDKGPCKNKLGHSRASVIWHRTQVISIFAGFGILLLIASPLLLLAAPCIVCCKCRVCSSDTKLDVDDDLPEAAELQTNADATLERGAEDVGGSGAEKHS